MGLSRRNAIIGVGGLIAGGGALVGTGAFTTVQAERAVNVETSGDANAFLTLDEVPNSLNSEYIDTTGDTIVIDITSTQQGGQGLNQNAITTIRKIVQVTNNGTQGVTALTLEFTETPNSINPDETFDFLVDESSNSADLDHTSGGVDILTGNNGISDTLNTGESITFGLGIDLINGGNSNNNLPQGGNYILTITAETGGGQGGGGQGGGGQGGNSFLSQPDYYNTGAHPNPQVGKPKYVKRRGQYAYTVFQENPGYIVTYDVSDPTNPSIADTVNTAPNTQSMNGGYALTLNSNTLYVCQNGGSFTAVDISDPTNMSILSRVFTGGQAFDIARSGNYVYTADTGGALRVFDVSDPANPSQVTTQSVAIAAGVAVNSGTLSVTSFSNNNLLLYDISNPGAPSQVGTYSTSFTPGAVDVSGDTAYVQAYQGTQIDIVDITDPTAPQQTDSISTPEQIPNGGTVRVSGGNLYLTTGASGNGHITIYDTADFSSPIKEYAVPGGPNIETGDVQGNYVYLPNYTDDGLTTAKIR